MLTGNRWRRVTAAATTLPRSRLALPALLAAFLAARVVVWAHGSVATSYDTFSYAYRNDPAFDRGPLVSFTGQAPRLWGVPLFFAAFDTDTARAFAQWSLGTLAWSLLAVALWQRLASTPARMLAITGVLGLGLTPQVTNWDLAILSESLTISLGVLTLAFFLRWHGPAPRHRTAALVALTCCAVWWTFTRPDIRLMTAVLATAIGWSAWRRRHTVRAVPAVVAVAVLAGALAWVSVITPNMDRTFANWSATGLPLREETLMYRLRLQVLPDPELSAAYRDHLGMPDCPAARRIAAGSAWAIVEFADAYRGCPELAAWGRRNATTSGYRLAVATPGPYLRYTWNALPESVGGTVLARTGTPLPGLVTRVAFPPTRWALPAVLAGLAAASAAALASGAMRRRRPLVLTAATVVVASITSIGAGLMYAVGVFGRYGIQEAVALRLCVLVLAATAVDAMIESARDRSLVAARLVPDRRTRDAAECSHG